MMTNADYYRKHDNRAWRWDLDMYWTGKVSPWMIENLDEFTNALLDSIGSSERASGTTSQPVDDVSFLTRFEGCPVSNKKLEHWFFVDDHNKKE